MLLLWRQALASDSCVMRTAACFHSGGIIGVDGVLGELHVGTVRSLDFLNHVRHRRRKTARRKQGGGKAADRPPQFLDRLVEKSHRRVETAPIQAGFRLLVPEGLQSCSSRNRV